MPRMTKARQAAATAKRLATMRIRRERMAELTLRAGLAKRDREAGEDAAIEAAVDAAAKGVAHEPPDMDRYVPRAWADALQRDLDRARDKLSIIAKILEL